MAIRSFLAFELPPEIKEVVEKASVAIRKSPLNVRWVKVDKIHLTVLFMGNVGPEDVPDIKDAVSEVCNGFGPFMLRLKGMGVFPDLRRSRILWVGLDGEIERMSLLKDSLQEHLSRFGIKKEDRRFRPHLTLGRFRKPERDRSLLTGILSEYKDFGSPACSMDELVLFKSDLRSGGAVYTKLGSWRLHGEK